MFRPSRRKSHLLREGSRRSRPRCPRGSRAGPRATHARRSGAATAMTRRSAPHAQRQVGALHLHHHVGAVGQRGAVHLGDAGGGDGRLLEAVEDGLEGRLERLLDGLSGGGERHGRHVVQHGAHLFAQPLREEPLAAGDDLPELDVRGPQPLEGEAQGARPRQALVAARDDHVEQSPQEEPVGHPGPEGEAEDPPGGQQPQQHTPCAHALGQQLGRVIT
jgi:hypothetical protein